MVTRGSTTTMVMPAFLASTNGGPAQPANPTSTTNASKIPMGDSIPVFFISVMFPTDGLDRGSTVLQGPHQQPGRLHNNSLLRILRGAGAQDLKIPPRRTKASCRRT